MFGASTGSTQAGASGFNFGGGAAATPSSSGFNFGATQAAPAATGGFSLSGTTTSSTPGSGSTGFSSGSTPSPSTSSGFSFNSAPPSTASGGFSFGAAPAPAPTASSGFSFGSTSTAPTATGGGFSFGSTSTAPTATGGGFSFGSTSTAPTATGGGFSFRGTAAPAAASSGFSFGGTSAAPTTSSTGFSFGGPPATNTAPSSGFGATSTPNSSFFGQQPAAPSTTTTGFGTSGFNFGAKPATGFGFGTASTTSTGTAAFGTTSTPGTSVFGGGFGTAPSTFGTAPAAPSAPTPIVLSADASVAQLNTIKAAYEDPAQSRFKFLMYNLVDPTQRHLYTRPPYISERLWNQAEVDNPDPLTCAPVPLLGFDDLLKRIKAQQAHAEKYNKYTEDLREQLRDMDKHARATEEKLDKCRHEHVQLFHALVKVMRDIELLQNYGKPLQREEMELAQMLKKLQTLLDSPGQYKARLNDAVSLLRVQKEAQPPPTTPLSSQDLQRLYEFMNKQRQGLEHLTNILNEDLADLQLIKETWRR